MAGFGVVLDNSITIFPSNSFSIGVTLQIIPVLAYVLFPTQIQRTSLGILKYSTVFAKTNEFGGIIQYGPFLSIKLSSENFLDQLKMYLHL